MKPPCRGPRKSIFQVGKVWELGERVVPVVAGDYLPDLSCIGYGLGHHGDGIQGAARRHEPIAETVPLVGLNPTMLLKAAGTQSASGRVGGEAEETSPAADRHGGSAGGTALICAYR